MSRVLAGKNPSVRARRRDYRRYLLSVYRVRAAMQTKIRFHKEISEIPSLCSDV
jgi:hypothetical protein